MKREAVELPEHVDPDLDDWLSRWHFWRDSARTARGYDDRSAVVGNYRNASGFDDDNGIFEDEAEVDNFYETTRQIEALPEQQKWAIQENARDLCIGYAVIKNPRLPSDYTLRALLLMQARRALRRRLPFLPALMNA